jgi:hypothetical protein
MRTFANLQHLAVADCRIDVQSLDDIIDCQVDV